MLLKPGSLVLVALVFLPAGLDYLGIADGVSGTFCLGLKVRVAGLRGSVWGFSGLLRRRSWLHRSGVHHLGLTPDALPWESWR